MNGKLLIPICLFVALQLFYDLFAVQYDPCVIGDDTIVMTRWSIFYFNMQYLCWLVLIVLTPKRHGFINKLPYRIIGLGLITYIIIALRYWNSPFDIYYSQVNSFTKYMLPIVIIFSGLIYFLMPIKSITRKIFKK